MMVQELEGDHSSLKFLHVDESRPGVSWFEGFFVLLHQTGGSSLLYDPDTLNGWLLRLWTLDAYEGRLAGAHWGKGAGRLHKPNMSQSSTSLSARHLTTAAHARRDVRMPMGLGMGCRHLFEVASSSLAWRWWSTT